MKRGEHPLRGVFGEGDLDVGMLVVEGGEDRDESGLAGVRAGDESDRHMPAEQSGELVRGLPYRLGTGDRGPRVGQYRLAHVGRRHRSSGAMQQRLPELSFEPPDLRAQARLGQVKAVGGTGEAGLLHDGDEVPELPKFHNR
nr:hypothetical protein [Actinomadura sp. 7K507]